MTNKEANPCPELLINSYYNIVKRTMIDMVPKAIMLNLVQYVSLIFKRGRWLTGVADLPRTRCKRSFWRTCTARASSTTC